jgi:hypothetical protein
VFVLGEEVWIAENVVWKGKFSYVRDLELGGELWRRRHRRAMHVGKRNVRRDVTNW